MGDVFAVVLLLGVGAGLLWLMSKRFFIKVLSEN